MNLLIDGITYLIRQILAETRDVHLDSKSDLSHFFNHTEMLNVRRDASDSWDMLVQSKCQAMFLQLTQERTAHEGGLIKRVRRV